VISHKFKKPCIQIRYGENKVDLTHEWILEGTKMLGDRVLYGYCYPPMGNNLWIPSQGFHAASCVRYHASLRQI
jgi:hypothetical protein